MRKPSDWESVRASGDYQSLPAGGYICRIKKIEVLPSKKGNKPVIHTYIDIDEGEYREYYYKDFQNNYSPDKKWRGMLYVPTQDKDGKTSSLFKRFVDKISDSNGGWQPAWGDDSKKFSDSFQNRLIGLAFGREEFISNDGKSFWTTKAKNYYTVEQIRNGEFKVPNDKHADGGNGGGNNNTGSSNTTSYDAINASAESAGFTALDDDDDSLPF